MLFVLLAIMLQVSIFSRFQILYGKLDVILLMVIAWGLQPELNLTDIAAFSIISGLIVGFISAEPIWLVTGIYLAAALFSNYLKNRFVTDPGSIHDFIRHNFQFFSFTHQYGCISNFRIDY